MYNNLMEKKQIKSIKWKVFFPVFVLAVAQFLFAQGSVSAPDEEKVEIIVQSGNNYNVSSVNFSPDGKNLASFSEDNTIRVWDSSTGYVIRKITIPSDKFYPYYTSCFSPDGRTLASGNDEGIYLWDTATGTIIREFRDYNYQRLRFIIRFSPDGKNLLSFFKDSILIWDSTSGGFMLGTQMPFEKNYNNAVQCDSPNHETFASNYSSFYSNDLRYDNSTIYLVQNATQNRPQRFFGHTDRVNSINFSPDGKILVSGSSDKTIRLWDTATGETIRTLPVNAVVYSVQFSPDGKSLTSLSQDGIKIWNMKTMMLISEYELPLSLSLSPNGKIQASKSDTYGSNNIILSDTAFGRKLRELVGHTKEVNSICFSPDGKTLASGSADGTIKTWNSLNGELLATLVGFNDGEWVVYTPDNFFICSDGGDKYITFKKGKSLYLVDEYGAQFKKQNIALVSEKPSEYSEKNNITDQPDIVKSEGDSSLIHVVKSLLGKSTCWAVLIGIKDYSISNNGFKPLPYAINDAEAVKKYLVNTMKISQDHIISLYNPRASRQNIEYYLGEKIPQLVGKDDRVIIYFSGHGSHEKIKSNEDFGYLIPFDGKKSNLYSTCISMRQVEDFSKKIPARQVLFILDSCFSGIAGAVYKKGIDQLPIETQKQIEAYVKSEGRQILAAGKADEEVVMTDDLKNSVYTHYLLKGLRGEADYDKNRVISIRELQVYLDYWVPQKAKQTPQIFDLTNNEGQFVFYPEGEN